MREYARSLPESAQASLRHQGFDAEVASLPGKYAGPRGAVLLGLLETEAVGVVALRPLEGWPESCEMKRLYVRPLARGTGLGRLLCEELLAFAKRAGYADMKLDTERDFVAAIGLYRSMGFAEIPRYNDDPMACTVWMGKPLRA
jgi:ribosomal protein S18 acetylase RimI-like enzyme